MPYSSNNQLPPAVKNLPQHGQDIFRKAFDAALIKYRDETTAFKVAWSAVSNKFQKDSQGKWVAKETIMPDKNLDPEDKKEGPEVGPPDAEDLAEKPEPDAKPRPNGSMAQPHTHNHFHDDGTAHSHSHVHAVGKEHESLGSSDEPASLHPDHESNMAADEVGQPLKLKKNVPPFAKNKGEEKADPAEAPEGDEKESDEEEAAPASDLPNEDDAPALSMDDAPGGDDDPDKKKESVRTSYFGEMINLKEATINKATSAIEVTLIKPGWSKNGAYYSTQLLGDSVPLFEGSKCFINHPTMSEGKERPERSVTDLVGWYEGVHQAQDGSLKGTLKAVKRASVENEIMPLVRAAIEENPLLIGESINILGRGSKGYAEGKHGTIVEEIAYVAGCDIVTSPAAGGKFDRMMASGDEFTQNLLKALSYEEWREARQDYWAKAKKEMQTARKDELESKAVKEAAELKTKLSKSEESVKEIQAEATRAQAELADKVREAEDRANKTLAVMKFRESGLPKDWSGTIVASLRGKTPEEMDVLIETERNKYFKTVKVTIKNKDVRIAKESIFRAQYGGIAKGLGLNIDAAPFEGETPEQYAARTKRK